jgi:hypothetical protein
VGEGRKVWAQAGPAIRAAAQRRRAFVIAKLQRAERKADPA